MKTQPFSKMFMYGALCCMLVFTIGLMSGCKGSDGAAGAAGATGAQGAQGPQGPQGTTGPAGADLTIGSVDASTFTFDDLRNIPLGGKIISAAVTSNHPVVTFQVVNKNTNEGIRGLRSFNLHIAQLQPEANGSNSYWLNYILTANATPRPTVDAVTTFNADGTVNVPGYSVVDNNDGTYVVTFAKDITSVPTVTYDPTLTHRIVVGVRSVVVPGVVGKTPGAYAGPINPITGLPFPQFTNTNGVNLTYDFVPSTGQVLSVPARDIVTIGACNQCHYKIQYGFPTGNNTSGHFGARTDTKTCVMCHTPQNVISGQTATTNVDFTPFIHKIHMGEDLPSIETGLTGTFNDVTFPQDIRECTTCHNGVNGDNWKNKPTRKACGSCHNNVNFATGANHSGPLGTGGVRTDDTQCTFCHDAASITSYHVPVTQITDTTASNYNVAYANNGNLPAGAYNIQYVITSVTVSANRTPYVTFQVLQNGTAVNFGTYAAATNANLIPNTTGGPTIAFAYNMTQDGITSPSDFNGRINVTLGLGNPTASNTGVFTAPTATSALWSNGGTLTANGITWTLSGPDSSNRYTVNASTPLPASATMLTAVMYGSFTQTNLSAYPYAAASASDFSSYVNTSGQTRYRLTNPGLVLNPAIASKAYTGTGFKARRTIVDNNKCNACHDQLGVKPNFHGGARNDGTICNICHTPNGNNSGWSYSFNTFIHGIHGDAKRTIAYTWNMDWSTVTYPGLVKNCEQCHISGSYDFTASASSSAASNLLLNTVATGTTSAAGANTSPYIAQTAGTVYGSGFAYTASTGTTAEAAATTLVSSPIAAACFSCHDSSVAMAHMENNGGSLYDPRSTALTRTEQCLVCHGPASNTAYGDYVPAIKDVHRWW